VTVKELNSKLVVSERHVDDLAAKLREMTNLYERSDKENKIKAQEIVRLCNDIDRCKMDNEGLRLTNGKLADEARAYKTELEATKKRLHELDQENRKLAHDREELARAYKVIRGHYYIESSLSFNSSSLLGNLVLLYI
jgi:chromosome segregation ATPase